MNTYNITIFTGGGYKQTLVIHAHKHKTSDNMIKFFDDQGRITHCYPASITSFTIDYDDLDLN